MNRSATRFELSRHVEIAQTCLQQIGNQVCDQLAHELDSVMEFGHFEVNEFGNRSCYFATCLVNKDVQYTLVVF